MLQNQTLYVHVGEGLSLRIGLPVIATWNNLTRPKKPSRGTIGFNSQTNNLELWDGSYWLATSME